MLRQGLRRYGSARDSAGFSLMELVMVISITGILAVVALPRFFDRGVFDESGYFEETLAAVRYAQKVALASGCDVQVSINAGGYSLSRRNTGCSTGTFSVAIPHPSRAGGFAASPPAGTSVGGTASLYFDRAGRPRDPGSGSILGAATNLSIGALGMRIEAETGYSHAL